MYQQYNEISHQLGLVFALSSLFTLLARFNESKPILDYPASNIAAPLLQF